MIYRTLHVYILRELMRVFLLTASTLTTLLAFGGMFRPLTRQGVDISQVMALMLYLMPAMLAYAIPIAALFAAVLVYWRMSTDNELTACRAGGVSFMAIVMPAFLLGVAVASMDLMFVNYVVPRFLQLTERAVRSDMASLIVSQISRQEKFQYEALPIVVTADYAEQVASPDPNVSIVVLHGMAGTFLDRGKPTVIAVAQEARVTIRNLPEQDAAEVSFSLKNGSGFDPNNGFRKGTGSIESIPWSRQFPSFIKSKAKFLNYPDLKKLDVDPSGFPPVGEIVDKIEVAHRYVEIENNVQQWWVKTSTTERGLVFDQSDPSNDKLEVTLYAPLSQINPAAAPEECLTFSGRSPGSVKVELRRGGKLESTYRCDMADMILTFDQFTGANVSGQLRLRGVVWHENNASSIKEEPESSPFLISGLVIPDAVKHTTVFTEDTRHELIDFAKQTPNPGVQKLATNAADAITRLDQSIISELHSRASFALSCLTLVLLGAALGILLRGKNPLAVFVVGFVPAIILVLLITAGRQLTEGGPSHTVGGVTLIWAGNGILLALLAGVYAKLLRT